MRDLALNIDLDHHIKLTGNRQFKIFRL